jgi:hypothetical protein
MTLFAVVTNSEIIYLFAAWNASTQHTNVQIAHRILVRSEFLFLLDGLPGHLKPPVAWTAGGCFLVWLHTFDISGMGVPAPSHATAGIATYKKAFTFRY